MTLLSYDPAGSIHPQRSTLAFVGLAAGLFNAAFIVAALRLLRDVGTPADAIFGMTILLLESAAIVFLSLTAVARVTASRGQLHGLLPAAIGAFLASLTGLVVVAFGIGYAAQVLVR
ncbi:MAG: hypothetical protein ACTHN5_08760 [Phycisphaerae bacterium]